LKLKQIFIAGQEGMVGSALLNLLKKNNLKIINCKRKDLDLTNQDKVEKWFRKNRPDIVINAAGKVGGILDNSLNPADYIYENTIISFNIINSSLRNGVKKFINLGSVSSYPRKSRIPIKEDYLLSSSLEPTNEAYAIAKIASIKYCHYIKETYKKEFISLQPANLYGIGDKFDLSKSHVIPALLKKFHIAKIKNKKKVEIWGSGKSEREFLNVEDLTRAILFCMKNKINHSILNVGSSDCISIRRLASLIKKITNFKGRMFFNKKYPDGVLRRKLDTALINKLGWKPEIKLEQGLKEYYEYYKKNY
jgi:GDP-L-fucose synthase